MRLPAFFSSGKLISNALDYSCDVVMQPAATSKLLPSPPRPLVETFRWRRAPFRSNPPLVLDSLRKRIADYAYCGARNAIPAVNYDRMATHQVTPLDNLLPYETSRSLKLSRG